MSNDREIININTGYNKAVVICSLDIEAWCGFKAVEAELFDEIIINQFELLKWGLFERIEGAH